MTHWFLTVSYDGAGNFSVYSQYPGVGVLNNFSDPIYDIGPNTTLNIAMLINPTTGAPDQRQLDDHGRRDDVLHCQPQRHAVDRRDFAVRLCRTLARPPPVRNISNSCSPPPAAIWQPGTPRSRSILTCVDINFSGTFGNTAFFDDSGSAQTDTFAGQP